MFDVPMFFPTLKVLIIPPNGPIDGSVRRFFAGDYTLCLVRGKVRPKTLQKPRVVATYACLHFSTIVKRPATNESKCIMLSWEQVLSFFVFLEEFLGRNFSSKILKGANPQLPILVRIWWGPESDQPLAQILFPEIPNSLF